LYGNELSPSISPLQAKLGWAVGWKKKSFLGDNALRNEKQNGSTGFVEYYRANSGRIPRKDSIIIDPFGKDAGRVLSGGFSPSLSRPIGTAWVKTENLENRKLDGWKALLRGKEIPINFSRPI
jgi:aminomethyltransferase